MLQYQPIHKGSVGSFHQTDKSVVKSNIELAPVDIEFRVRYAETDAMGVAHHASYIVYFEEGRGAFSRHYAAPYADLEKSGYLLLVTDLSVRYLKAARYDQLLTIRTEMVTLRSRGVTFAYQVIDKTSGDLLVTAQTTHICISKEGTVSRLPAWWLNEFRKNENAT